MELRAARVRMELGSQWVPVAQWDNVPQNGNESSMITVTVSFTFPAQYFKLPVFACKRTRVHGGLV